MSKLARVTFTGVDERTDLGALRAICEGWSRVEFAVLWSESGAGREPRYPADPFAIIRSIPAGHRAMHLCGAVARRFMDRDLQPPLNELASLCRIQVNSKGYTHERLVTLGWLSKAFRCEVIVQSRQAIVPWIPGLSVLHDASGGRGKLPQEWPKPEWVHEESDVVGYAGGLGPHNIADELPLIAAAAEGCGFAIDMESGVRTDDWFDVGKVLAVLKAIDEWEAEQAYARKIGDVK